MLHLAVLFPTQPGGNLTRFWTTSTRINLLESFYNDTPRKSPGRNPDRA